MSENSKSSLTMMVPFDKPFFIDIHGLRDAYDRYENELLKGTGWLMEDIGRARDLKFAQMHYFGLSTFFTEISLGLAYWLALREVGYSKSSPLLFHGNNLVLRCVAIWNRMGYGLNELFDLGIPDDEMHFGTAIDHLCTKSRVERPVRNRAKKLKMLYDKGADLRTWRNKYIHQYGEYFEKERGKKGDIVSESFSWNPKDRIDMVERLAKILIPTHPQLKRVMRLCYELFI